MSLAVGLLATYSSKQVVRWQTMFQRNLKTALELTAIEPFVASLPIEMQHQLKMTIGDRTFGRDESPFPQGVSVSDVIKSKELYDLILGIIRAANGK
jgi:hypothetical protein